MSTDTATRVSELTLGVATEIRALLGRRSLSRSEFARRLGVDDTWIGKRLNGRTDITISDMEKIARALGVSAADLLPHGEREVTVREHTQPITARPRLDSRGPAGRQDSRGPSTRPVRQTRPFGYRDLPVFLPEVTGS